MSKIMWLLFKTLSQLTAGMTERRKEQQIYSQRSTPASRIDNDCNTQENNIFRAMEAPGQHKH